MSLEQGDHYQILGLNREASTSEIEEAYDRVRAQMLEEKPDADLSFLLYVYEVLSNPQRRQVYDSLLAEVAAPKLVTAVQVSNTKLGVLDIPQIIYLLVEMRAGETGAQNQLPLNVCLVVDCSTSMRGERLDQVRKGILMLLEKLSAGDVLSLIKFSDRAQVVLPAKHVGEHKEPVSKIQAMEASGGTEIYQGLVAGVGQMKQIAPGGDYNSHLILLTDGNTYGDEGKCLRLASRLADEVITLSAFGIGADWDDQFLDAMVGLSGGHADYIAAPGDIVSRLEQDVQEMGAVVARRVQLRAKWPRSIELLDSFRLSPFAQPLHNENGQIQLGDIERRTTLRFLLEYRVLPQSIPIRIRIPLTFKAEIPGQGKQKIEEEVLLSINKKATFAVPPPDIVRAVRLLTLYRLNEKAWQEVESGYLERAATRMKYLSTRFLQAGETILAKQALVEAQRVSQAGTLSPESYKNLKYGTRALMGKAIQWDRDDSV